MRRLRTSDFTSPASLGLAGAAVALVAAGVAVRTPWLPLEEAAAVEGARALAGGAARAGVLWQLLLWPAAHLLSAGGFLTLAKVVAALAWVALAVPAYLLGRVALQPRPAAAAAALSVLCAGCVYGTTALPDTLALLLAASAIAAAARGRTPAALGLALAAVLARPWLVALPVAIAWATAAPRRRRALLRWPGSTVLAVAAGAAYAAWAAAGTPPAGELLRAGFGSLGLVALAAGVVPVPLAFGSGNGAARRLLGPCCVAAGVGGALAGASGPVLAEDRAALFLVPLAFVLAADALLHGFDRRRAGLSAVGVVVTALPIPWPLPAAASGTLGGALWRDFGSHWLLIGLVAVLAFAPLLRLRPAALAVPAAALVLAGTVAAFGDVADASRALRLGVPLPRSQVDDAVGRGADVTWALSGNADPRAVAEAQLWNRSLRRVVRVDPSAADPDTGLLDPDSTEYAVGAIPLAGRRVAEIPLGTIVRVDGPLRATEVVGGLYDDGWSGFETVYKRFSGAQAPATVTIDVSRASWHGRDKPAQVTADASPLGGAPFAERITTIHAEQRTTLRVPVPPPPFQIVVHVAPTFSPAELGGGSDTRQLGAVLRFRYDATR